MDMSLGSLLGARPTSAFRPRFDAVGRWLLELAGPEAVAEASVFTNVVPGSTEVVRPWVEALRNVGFAVFAKPKTSRRLRYRRRHAGPHPAARRRGHAAPGRGGLRRRAGVPGAAGGAGAHRHRDHRHRVPRARELRARLGRDRVHRPGGHRRACSASRCRGSPWTRCPTPVPGCRRSARCARCWSRAGDPRHSRLGSPPRCAALRPGLLGAARRRRRRRRRRAGSPTSGRASAAPPTDAPVRALPGALLPGLVNTHAHTPMIAAARDGRRPAAAALAARGDVAGRGPADRPGRARRDDRGLRRAAPHRLHHQRRDVLLHRRR